MRIAWVGAGLLVASAAFLATGVLGWEEVSTVSQRV
jgi:hypothetical protein